MSFIILYINWFLSIQAHLVDCAVTTRLNSSLMENLIKVEFDKDCDDPKALIEVVEQRLGVSATTETDSHAWFELPPVDSEEQVIAARKSIADKVKDLNCNVK